MFGHLLSWCTIGIIKGDLSTLNALQEVVDGKDPKSTPPPYPMTTLVAYAISGSPNECLMDAEIEIALMRRFLYFSEHCSKVGVS